MGKIHVLQESISNKIAAGEVVERPASVVKELIENSIDAGATSITVEIKNGGISYIRVADNGCGMDSEDAKASFIRHATSKIAREEDLNGIRTLGFRGEALASIASVSEMEMQTKLKDSTLGTKVSINGGTFTYVGSTGCSDGTSIVVKNLFFNTPARLKFLKKESRETAVISDILYKLAVSKPDISFKYINNGKLIFSTQGDGVLKNAILTLYGKELYDSLIKVEYKGNILSISGYIGKPDAARSNRSFQSFYLNNRYIQNRMLSTAVDSAYKTFLPVNKYAFCMLFLSILPELVDVNVHPTKAEVRFQDEREVFSAIFNTVRNGLAGESLIPHMEKPKPLYVAEQQRIMDDRLSEEKVQIPQYKEIAEPEGADGSTDALIKESRVFEPVEDIKISDDKAVENAGSKNLLPPLVIIGQCHYTYILAQGPDGLYIIDQHAAHERIMYEKLKKSYEEGGVQSQKLLSPLVVELSQGELCTVKENMNFISKLGFELELFGNNSVILRSVPLLFGVPQLKKLFLEIISEMESGDSAGKSTIDNTIYTMACKSAVKANDRLDIKEMEEIINKLRQTVNPYTCPHGRPTIIKLTQNELEKKFKRIQ